MLVDLDLCRVVQNVRDLDGGDAVSERLGRRQLLVVLRVHDGQEEGVDVLLDVFDLVDPFADDAVQVGEPLPVVGLDVHEGIDAVVGLGVPGVQVFDAVAVPEDRVQLVLEERVGDDPGPGQAIPRIEDADALPESPVELATAGEDHGKHFAGQIEEVQKRLVEGHADGTGLIPEYPFVLLVRKELPLEGIVGYGVVQEFPPVRLGNHEQRAVVARARDLEILGVGKGEELVTGACPRRLEGASVRQAPELLQDGVGLTVRKGPELPLVQPPHGFIAGPFVGAAIVLEFHEQVVQKSALPAPRRPLKDDDPVLLGTVPEGRHVVDKAVGKQPIGKERMVRVFDEEPIAVVVDVVDRLGILRVLIRPVADVARDHVVKHLEDVSESERRLGSSQLHVVHEGDGSPLLPVLNPPAEVG